MKPLLPALLALAVSAPALAAKIAMEDQSQIPPAPAKPEGQQWFQPPHERDLPDDAFGRLVQQGLVLLLVLQLGDDALGQQGFELRQQLA